MKELDFQNALDTAVNVIKSEIAEHHGIDVKDVIIVSLELYPSSNVGILHDMEWDSYDKQLIRYNIRGEGRVYTAAYRFYYGFGDKHKAEVWFLE